MNFNFLIMVQTKKLFNNFNTCLEQLRSNYFLTLAFLICTILLVCYSVYVVVSYFKQRDLQMLYKMVKRNDSLQCIRLLEKHPEYVNSTLDESGFTPFLIACLNGNTLLVKYMLTIGADIKKTSAKKETCFYLAVYNRIDNQHSTDASCLHALYHAGADINAANDKGFTPLHMASMFGHAGLVKWLLSKGASTDISPEPYKLAMALGIINKNSNRKNVKLFVNNFGKHY